MSEHVPADRTVQVLAAGFNAFGQLSSHHADDIRDLYPILTWRGSGSVRVLFSCWSSTVLVVGHKLVALGFQRFEQVLDDIKVDDLKDAFGDHNGMIGCLDNAGRLYLLATHNGVRNGALKCQSRASSPEISHIALAANGRIAVALAETHTTSSFNVAEFDSFADFMTWFRDPSAARLQPGKQTFSISGSPKQLLGSVATFLLLSESGEVYSWGDPRYQSLGRPLVGEEGSAAHAPAAIESMGGLRITKVACGGWMSAALSEDRALYIWGTGTPGDDTTVKPLREADAGEAVLVEIMLPDEEPMDVMDVGVGNNHIVLVGERGDLWGIGANRNGQLGFNSEKDFVDDWTLIRRPANVQSFTCGPKCTLVLTSDPI